MYAQWEIYNWTNLGSQATNRGSRLAANIGSILADAQRVYAVAKTRHVSIGPMMVTNIHLKLVQHSHVKS